MADMSRDDLRDYLLEHNVPFHRSAHIDVLRALYLEYINKAAPDVLEGDNGDKVASNQVNDEPNDQVQVSVVAVSNTNKVSEEESALLEQIHILELKQRVAQLRRELAASSVTSADTDISTTQPSFTDIQHSIVPFSGSDVYDANKWLDDFDRACASVNGDDIFKLKCVRRLMKPDSDAELFLRTDSSATYNEFRTNFLQTFGHNYSVSEIIEKLNKTKFRPSEMTVMGYILRMQEIAARAQLDEQQTIRCIIDGFRDRSVNIAVLYPAQNLLQLKQLARTYEHLRERNAASSLNSASAAQNSVSAVPPSVQRAKPTIAKPGDEMMCYNCSGRGHASASCPFPRRPVGSCFRCGSNAHKVASCPLPAPSNRRIALADEFIQFKGQAKDDEEIGPALSSINMVSVAFFLLRGEKWQCNDIISLFDTGSPINLIRASEIPPELLPTELKNSGYKGLGNFQLQTYGEIPIYIQFRDIFKEIMIFVVQDSCIPYPVVLGREFLNTFNIKLIFLKQSINEGDNKLKNNVLHCLFSASHENFDNSDSVSDYTMPVASAFHNNNECPDIYAIELYHDEISIDINPLLDPKNSAAVRDIIRVNYENVNEIPAVEHDYKMHIRLTSDVPISFRPRSLSQSDKRIVEENVSELLRLGFIRPSESPYAFPLVLVGKKDGTKRQCVDYRALNKITVRDSYPLPLIDDCLEKLEGKRVFTTIDLKNGFHHVKVSEESIKYTAFVTPSGQFEYTVMPFGLKNGPMVFQRFINFVLSEFIREGSVVVYMDDVTLATDSISEHLSLLARVLRRIAEFRLQINFSKCQFCYYEISLLGFDVSYEGIRPNNKHLKAIERLTYPKSAEEVRKCLGLLSYFRRFIPSFSSVAKCLRELTKPEKKFDFNEDCEQAFDYLREKLISAPVLALYNPERETELHCDGSSLGFGAILFQKQDDEKFHPIAYFSRAASPAESRYHGFELETLAIVYALRKFRIYLDGIPFKIITDCNSVTLTLNKKSIHARIARWAFELENFDYTIQHRSGANMTHVDFLSRFPLTNKNSETSAETVCALQPADIDAQLSITQNRDPAIVRLREKLKKEEVRDYVLEDGLVFRVTKDHRLLLYVPQEMENNIIRETHEKTCHMGITKCIDQIRLHYWFPNMQEKVERFIKNCLKCVTFSLAPHCNYRTLHPIPKEPLPFDTLHLDHFGPLPSIISKRKHILVVMDSFTKFVKLFAVNSTSAKEVCASLDKYIQFYSRPRRIITDRGACFTSFEFSAYLLDNHIEHTKVATASPQANGQAERVNRVLKSTLAKVSEPVQHSDWAKLLTKVEYAVNNSVHSVTKFTPSQLLFGVPQRGKEVDALSEFLDAKHEHMEIRDINKLRIAASDNIKSHQEKSVRVHSEYHKPHLTFSVGDFIMIRDIDTTIGSNKKFSPKFRGPYQISKILPNDRYVVCDIENNPYSQIPYNGILEASRIRHWIDWRD